MAKGIETQYRVELELTLSLRGDSIFALNEIVNDIKRCIGNDAEVTLWNEKRSRHDIPSSVARQQPSVVMEEKTNG